MGCGQEENGASIGEDGPLLRIVRAMGAAKDLFDDETAETVAKEKNGTAAETILNEPL
jgi:hypothetical protein